MRGIVIERIEAMAGLKVTEVNVTVDDLNFEGGSGPSEQELRAQ